MCVRDTDRQTESKRHSHVVTPGRDRDRERGRQRDRESQRQTERAREIEGDRN